MQQYAYNMINGFPIAEIRGRNFLIDTALPFTVADRPLLIEGRRFEVASEVMGVTTSQLSATAGFQLDGILGANVTDQFVIKIQPEQHTLTLDHYLDAFPQEIAVQNLGGSAIINQTIADKKVKALLTLGTRLSYVKKNMVEGRVSIGRESDVLSVVGSIETEVFILPVTIGQRTHDFRFGVIPDQLWEFIEQANVTASIGSELLQHYALSLSMDDEVLMLDPLRARLH